MQSIATILDKLKVKHYGGNILAFCPCHKNTKTPALSIGYDKHNDKLLVYCHAGCNSVDVLKAINAKGINFDYSSNNSTGYKQHNNNAKEYIDKLIKQLKPIKGTIAEKYLRQERFISCDIASSIKFHPNLKHYPTQGCYPAMVAVIQDISSKQIMAIHRTYLSKDGNKASIAQNRMILGKASGGCVMLNDVQSNVLVVGEGIETSLSLKMLYPDYKVVSCLSSSGMKKLILPDKPSQLIIGIDNDKAGINAGEELATRAIARGWKVEIATPENVNDWNDAIRTNQYGVII